MAKKGGFECQFVEKPPKAVQSECPVCLLVLREPYQATCCGYAFCGVCNEKIKHNNKPCPCCNVEIFESFEDKRLRRSLYEFRVHCTNKQQGCQWEGELGQLDNHLNYNPTEDKQPEECQFSKIECLYCSMVLLRSQTQIHLSNHCPMRPFSCPYCKGFNSSYEDVTTNHWPVCGYYLMLCPNKCGETLQCKILDSHITNDCPLTIIDCDFQHVGCEVRLPRKDMSGHLEENVVRHISLQAVSYKRDMTNIARLEEENKELRQQVEKLTQDLQMHQINTPLCPVELTVTNFGQKRNNRDEWKSSPFYTHLKGYKMLLNVFANGMDMGNETHVSVYTTLMKGEFDDQLSWPFRGKFEIQLLNQDQAEGKYTTMIDFSASEAGDPGERVLDGDESKKKFGRHQFIAHGDLRPKYLKNDCLRFCIKSI